MARGRPKGVKNRPKYIIDEEKREKERERAQRIANGEVIKRGRKPGTKNRSKEVIAAEREARIQLRNEKQAEKKAHRIETKSYEPLAIPVNSIFVLKSEKRKRGKNARQFVVESSSPWLVNWHDENNKSHSAMPENIVVVGEKEL